MKDRWCLRSCIERMHDDRELRLDAHNSGITWSAPAQSLEGCLTGRRWVAKLRAYDLTGEAQVTVRGTYRL